MFIEPKTPVTVAELIRRMIVQSGNDACVALAEAIAGTEAASSPDEPRGGTSRPHRNPFHECHGHARSRHYSTAARDLARLTGADPRFPRLLPIRPRNSRYNKITQPNRNRLLARPDRGRGQDRTHRKRRLPPDRLGPSAARDG